MNKTTALVIIAFLAIIAGEIAYQIAQERAAPVQVDQLR
jgi:hypothetical protein